MVPTWTRPADQRGSLVILNVIMIGHLAATLLYSFTPLVVSENRVWYTIFGRVLAMGFMQALSPVADAYALRRLGGSRSLYGRERAWGSFSWGLSAVLLGALMTVMDLTLAYELFTAACTFATLLALKFSPSDLTEVSATAYVKPQKQQHDEQVFVIEDEEDKEMQAMTAEDKQRGIIKMDPKVQSAEAEQEEEEDADTTHVKEKPKMGITIFLRQAELTTLVFLFVMLCLEMGQALTESLEFLFIVEELKSSPLLCGISVAVAVVLEVPLLFASEPLLRRVGILLLMLFGIFVFCVRVTAFTFITSTNPWLILGVEPLAGIYVAFLKMSSVSFMSQAAPKGQEAVAMGTMNVFRCMGQVFGTLIGSSVLQNYGPTVLYRSFGVLVILAGFVLIWIFHRKKRIAVLTAAATTVLSPDETARITASVHEHASSVTRTKQTGGSSASASAVEVYTVTHPSIISQHGEYKDSSGEDKPIDVIRSEVALLELHKT